MAYSNFTYDDLKQQFGVSIASVSLGLRANIVEPSSWLQQTLSFTSLARLRTEKAKSEMVIAPILTELTQRNKDAISMYSGTTLNADAARGLNGECDFMLSNKPNAYLLESPVIALVEAKNDNLDNGIPQCIAQMLGARIFNEREGVQTASIHGCVTTGAEWQFLQLDIAGTHPNSAKSLVLLDTDVYFIDNLPRLLGALQTVVDTYR
jgi:hypothetical protein